MYKSTQRMAYHQRTRAPSQGMLRSQQPSKRAGQGVEGGWALPGRRGVGTGGGEDVAESVSEADRRAG